MTDDELADIERIWAAATPGPWRDGEGAAAEMHVEVLLLGVYDEEGDATFRRDEDRTAVARAPEHIAALLAEVKRLRAMATALAADWSKREGEYDPIGGPYGVTALNGDMCAEELLAALS